ncbi:MAG TPA: hypothetical protein VGN34_12570 [Ktedonobacteraceae bacterium]|jgi:hypothetical protein
MNGSDNGGWQIAGSATLGCTYSGGGYQVATNSSSTYVPCTAQNLTGRDFAFQAQMTITSSTSNGGGLIFRQAYRFHVDNGSYDLAGPPKQVSGTNPYLNVNGGQSMSLTVIAKGSDIYLYVNGYLLTHIQDSTSSSGGFGLFAVDFSSSTTIVFTNVKIWQL